MQQIRFFNINKFFDLIFLILPFSLIAGNLILNLNVLLIIILGFLNYNQKIKKNIYENRIFVIFFLIIFFFNIIFSENKSAALIGFLGVLKYFLFFLVLIEYLDKKNFNSALFFVLVSIILVCLSVFLIKVLNPELNRIGGIYGREHVAGSHILKLLPIACLFFFLKKQKFFFLLFLIFFSFIGIVVSGDRSPLYIFVLTFILGILLLSINLRYKIFLVTLFFVFILNLFLFSKSFQDRALLTFLQLGIDHKIFLKTKVFSKISSDQINYNKKYFYNKNFINSRWGEHFIVAIEIAKKNIVFGAGLKNFRIECWKNQYDLIHNKSMSKDVRCNTHPHNIYIEVFSEMGIVGLIFFFTIIFSMAYRVYKCQQEYNLKILLFLILFMLFFPAQTTGSIFSTFNGFFYYYNLAAITFLTKKIR